MTSYLVALKIVPIIVALLQYFMLGLSSKPQPSKMIIHQRDFWGSLTLMGGLFLFYDYGTDGYKLISLLAWPWFLRTITLLYEDLSRKVIKAKDQIFSLEIFGGVLSVVGYFFFKNPLIYLLPFLLCMAFYSQSFIREVLKGLLSEKQSIPFSFSSVLIILCILERFIYPFVMGSNFSLSFYPLISVLIISGLAFGVQLSSNESNAKEFESDFNFLLNEKSRLLMEQSKYAELGMMVAGITHEINNPLMVIQARTTQLLRIHKDSNRLKEVSDGLEQILYTTERIGRTIQGIREFVRPEKKNELEKINLKVIMDDVYSFCGQRFTNHGINLRAYDLDRYSLVVNKIQIEQVILNLLNNSFDAIEYLPEKWIELSAKESTDSIQIMIKDSGGGIKDEVALRMMDPFYTTKPPGKGTGIGLSLSKGLVESHGGRLVYLKQEPHTTFMIELPKNPMQLIKDTNQVHLH